MHKFTVRNSRLILSGLLLTALAAACTAAPNVPAAPPTRLLPTVTVVPTPTPHPRQVTLCTTEPTAIHPFAPSQAGTDVLALFYEFPAEEVDYQWEARLLKHLPSPENNEVTVRTVRVLGGARYVDETGAVQTNDSGQTLALPQLVVTFTLKSALRWSDGEPLTSEDVLLGFHLAQDPDARGTWPDLVKRTASFEALDDSVLRWTGLPGYLSTEYPGFLFPPQPAHRWQKAQFSEVLEDHAPPGTGPFTIESWEPGRGISLRPNPHYVGETPLLERVVVRFPQLDISQWPKLLTSGECDIILPDPATEIDWKTWETLMAQQDALIWASLGPEPVFLRLDFNITQSTPLTNQTVRMAIASCIDKERLIKAQPGQALLAAESFLPPGHPAFTGEALYRIPYSPQTGQTLLEGIGWRDEDGDGIREAHGVKEISNNSPLSLTLYLAPQYTFAAANIAADLESCGIGIIPQPTDSRLLYAADPVSPLFGRQFDLALFGWWTEVPLVCGAWLTERIPSEDNAWIGENFSGYSTSRYDEACKAALRTIDTTSQYAALQQASVLLSQELPTLFLTWRPFWLVARPEVQGLKPDDSNPAAIWNIEAIDIEE